MADAQVLYAESVAATTASTTTWVDLASISAASFTADKTYLIIANQICKNNSASVETRVRLVHGTTPTVFDDAGLAWEGILSTQEHEESYMFLYTQPGTTELVKLQISSAVTSTVTNILSQIIAIKLSDDFTVDADYFWDEDLVNYTLTNTHTAKAITGSFTPNGTDKWLFIGHMIYDVGTPITSQIGFDLYDSVAGILTQTSQEGEDATNDYHGHNIYWVGVPTNAARTLAVRPFQAGTTPTSVMLASRVMAINLSKFAQSAYAFSASEVNPATTPTYTNVATVSPTPDSTGNWVYLAFLIQDVNDVSAEFETRLQVNPDGGGLVSDPAYPTTPPSVDNWDATDETAHSVFKLRQLNTGGARQINFDVREVTDLTGRVEDCGIVAFSVALATTGININLAAAAIAATGQSMTVTPGAVSKALAPGDMTATGQPLAIQPGTYTAALAYGTLTAEGPATTITPGAVSKALAVGDMIAEGQAISLGGGYIANLSAAGITAEGPAIGITPGAATTSLASGDMTLEGQTTTIATAIMVNLQAGTITIAGQTMTITPGAIVVTLVVAVLTLLGLNISIPSWTGGVRRSTLWRWFVLRRK